MLVPCTKGGSTDVYDQYHFQMRLMYVSIDTFDSRVINCINRGV